LPDIDFPADFASICDNQYRMSVRAQATFAVLCCHRLPCSPHSIGTAVPVSLQQRRRRRDPESDLKVIRSCENLPLRASGSEEGEATLSPSMLDDRSFSLHRHAIVEIFEQSRCRNWKKIERMQIRESQLRERLHFRLLHLTSEHCEIPLRNYNYLKSICQQLIAVSLESPKRA